MSKCSQGSVLICIHSNQWTSKSAWCGSQVTVILYTMILQTRVLRQPLKMRMTTTIAVLTTNACKKMINKQCHISWQHSWNISNTAGATYQYHPRVGQNSETISTERQTYSSQLPAVTSSRFCFWSSLIQIRRKYYQSLCLWKYDKRCPAHSLARQDLITSVTDIWNNSDETGKIVISAPASWLLRELAIMRLDWTRIGLSANCPVTDMFRQQPDKSPTNHLAVSLIADWSTRRLVNSPKCLI